MSRPRSRSSHAAGAIFAPESPVETAGLFEMTAIAGSRALPPPPEPRTTRANDRYFFHGPQIASVSPGPFWMFTNSVDPSGLKVHPASSERFSLLVPIV